MLDLTALKSLKLKPMLGLKRWVSTHSSYIIAVVHGKIPEKRKRNTSDFIWDFSVDDNLKVHYYFWCHSCGTLLHSDYMSQIVDGARLFRTVTYPPTTDWKSVRTLDQCIVCPVDGCSNHVWPIFRDYQEIEPLIVKAVEKKRKELNSVKR